MPILRTMTVVGLLAVVTAASADIRADVEAVFAQDMALADLARAKLELDGLASPTVDVEAELVRIDAMAAEVAAMVPPGADAWAKVETLRRYLFDPGPWNGGSPFA